MLTEKQERLVEEDREESRGQTVVSDVINGIDEADFNLAKACWQGRNLIRKRATVNIPGQRGANTTVCPAISSEGLVLHKPLIGPYSTESAS